MKTRLVGMVTGLAMVLMLATPAAATSPVPLGDCPGGNSGFYGYWTGAVGIGDANPVDRNHDYWICAKQTPNGKVFVDNNVKLGKGTSVGGL